MEGRVRSAAILRFSSLASGMRFAWMAQQAGHGDLIAVHFFSKVLSPMGRSIKATEVPMASIH
jgi:hypothetical protein